MREPGIAARGLVLLGIALAPGPVAAQVSINDSTVIAAVGSALVEKASFLFARAALDTTGIPLVIALPAEATAPGWTAFQTYLHDVLRGRELRPDDLRKYEIDLGGVESVVDTVVAWITVTVQDRCATGWIENGSGYRIVFKGADGIFWRNYHLDTEIPIHGWGCPVDVPPVGPPSSPPAPPAPPPGAHR